MAATSFKVIVVGGGPVGLTAAHALSKAGIDFVVLERRPEVVIDAGSNLVLSPVGLRTMMQLGILKDINAVSSPLDRIDRLDHRGRDIGDVQWFNYMKKKYAADMENGWIIADRFTSFGMAPRVISRHDLTKVLYHTLPVDAQSKILSNKKLSDITTTAEGVVATCADGSSHSGTILVGADGAHSLVRDLMRTRALECGSTEVNAETPFLTTYRCLWVRFPKLPGLPVGTTCETHGSGAATQLFVGEDSGVIGVYERLAQPTQERIRHTQSDQVALVERWGHIPVTPSAKLTLRDIYTSRLESGLVSLEEGVCDHWSWDGRIVLTGDAAHKFTPSTGAGCNNGMIDIVVLINELHAAVQNARVVSGDATASPSKADIAEAFQTYQNTRHGTVVAECAQSGQATTTATWTTGVHRFIDRNIMSRHIVQRYLINSGAEKVATTPTLDFVSCSNEINGRVPWKASAPRAIITA
jgi:2-polyprenyl-6-methoxyphenol hydroxylase-like FAD-dependent oxidoreductase